MGRPLNKKYFGNRNIGTTGTTDDYGIGGQGVASVTIGGTNNDYIAVPTVTFAAPTLPTGVTATAGAVTMVVKSVAITNAGGSYLDEEVVELGSGSAAGGTGTVDGTYTTRASFRIKSVDGGGGATSIELVNGGSYTVLAYNGATAVSNPGSTVTEMFTTGGTGNNLRVEITWGVLAVPISEKGSGYVSAPAITMTGNATKTAVLTTDTGGVGSSTNQENAIRAYAYNGSSLVAVDIVRQVSGSAQNHGGRYRINDSTTAGNIDNDTNAIQASAIGRLVTSTANETVTANGKTEWEMNIVAIDSDGGTYLVKKLMSRKVVLVPAAVSRLGSSAGSQFASGKEVAWTFNGTSGTKVRSEQPYLEAGVNVKIEND